MGSDRRIPNTSSQSEVRNAFQRFDADVETLEGGTVSIDVIAAEGSLIVKDSDATGKSYVEFSQGTDNQVLVSAGVGVNPVWTTDLDGLTSIVCDNITIDGATILSDTGAIGFGDENLTTTGNISIVSDVSALQFGASTDATIRYDASNLEYTIVTSGSHSFIGGDVHVDFARSGHKLKIRNPANTWAREGVLGFGYASIPFISIKDQDNKTGTPFSVYTANVGACIELQKTTGSGYLIGMHTTAIDSTIRAFMNHTAGNNRNASVGGIDLEMAANGQPTVGSDLYPWSGIRARFAYTGNSTVNHTAYGGYFTADVSGSNANARAIGFYASAVEFGGGRTSYAVYSDGNAYIDGDTTVTGTLIVDTMTIAGGSITDSSGAISFGNENLTTTGTLGAGATTVTSLTDGTATLSGGSLTAVKLGTLAANGFVKTSAGDGTLSVDTTVYLTTESDTLDTVADRGATTDQTLTAGGFVTTGTVIVGAAADMVISVGSITSVSGAISFGDENLTTTGSVGIGTVPSDKLHVVDTRAVHGSAAFWIQQTGASPGTAYGAIIEKTGASQTNVGGSFSATGATNNYGLIVSSGSVGIGITTPTDKLEVVGNISATTTIAASTLLIAAGSITDSSGAISFGNENLSTTGKAGFGDASVYVNSHVEVVGQHTANKYHSALHIRTTDTTYGAFIGSSASGRSIWSTGAHFANGDWLARGTTASGIYQNFGNILFYTDTGLTDGVEYTPTQRGLFDSSGLNVTGTVVGSNIPSPSVTDKVLTSTGAGTATWQDPAAAGHVMPSAAYEIFVGTGAGTAAWTTDIIGLTILTVDNITIDGSVITDSTGLVEIDDPVSINSSGASTTWDLQVGDLDSIIRIGEGDGSGHTVVGQKQTNEESLIEYEVYLSDNAYWDSNVELWRSVRSTLGRRAKFAMGYHQNAFTWDFQSATGEFVTWTELMNLDYSTGDLTVSGEVIADNIPSPASAFQMLQATGAGTAIWTTAPNNLTSIQIDNITINGATIISDTGAISFGDENLTTTGTVIGKNIPSPATVDDVLICTSADTAAWSAPVWPRLLSSNETIYIRTTGNDSNDGETSGTALLTLQEGINRLYRRIANGYTITIDLGESHYTVPAALSPAYPYGYNVEWQGVSESHVSCTVSNIGSVTASGLSGLSYLDFDITLPATKVASVGDFISVTAAAGGANPHLAMGSHEVTAIAGTPSGNVATVRMYRRTGPTDVPTTSAVLSVTVIKTVLDFTGSNGLKLNGAFHSGTWGNTGYGICFKGSHAYNGIWALNGASIILGNDGATSGWATNLYAQNGALIYADYTCHAKTDGDIVKCQNGATINLRYGSVLTGGKSRGAQVFIGGTLAFNQGHIYLTGANFGIQCHQGGIVDFSNGTVKHGHASSYALSASTGGRIDAASATISDYTLEINNSEGRGAIYDGNEGTVYGEIYAFDAALTHTISGTGIGNKVQVTAFNANGHSHRLTPDHTSDDITMDIAGDYMCTVSINIESVAGGAQTAGTAVYKNNGATLFPNLHMHRKLSGGGGDLGAVTMNGVIALVAGDTIEVWIWNNTTGDIIVDDVTLTLVRIGR